MTSLTIPADATKLGPALDLDAVVERAAGLARQARAPNTLRAYESDWRDFECWCSAQGFDPIPASPAVVGLFLAAHEHLSVATLSRRTSSIAARHRQAGHSLDTRHPAIADVLRGLRRERGSRQRHAEALTVDRLRRVLTGLGDDLGALRDRALLLVGTAAALRRSELVALDADDITVLPEGLRIAIQRSKTDAEGHGAVLAAGRTGRSTCPAAAFEQWLAAAGITEGAAFRAVDRHGRLGDRLSGNAISLIVQRRAAAGLDAAAFSGHSLRSGFATSAARGARRVQDRLADTARLAGRPAPLRARGTVVHRKPVRRDRSLKRNGPLRCRCGPLPSRPISAIGLDGYLVVMRWVTLLLPRLSLIVSPMTLFIIACIVGGLAYLFLKVGPARGRTFIRAVAFLDALKAGQSVERANATIASPGLTEHPEMIQFAKSVLHARGGKQLPLIAEARRRGMIEPK